MISKKIFKISVENKGDELLVTVEHVITGKKLYDIAEKNLVDEKIYELKQKIISSFFKLIEIRIDTGRSSKGTFIQITHLPTGKNVSQNGINKEKILKVKEKLLEELLFNLWNDNSLFVDDF